jgi:hypothetical protein
MKLNLSVDSGPLIKPVPLKGSSSRYVPVLPILTHGALKTLLSYFLFLATSSATNEAS